MKSRELDKPCQGAHTKNEGQRTTKGLPACPTRRKHEYLMWARFGKLNFVNIYIYIPHVKEA